MVYNDIRDKRILVVDDMEDIRNLLREALQNLGHEVELARDGWEALAMLELDVDLVITDAAMPGMDGFEVVRNIRNDKRHRDLPIIMVTGLSSPSDRLRAAECGADDFIVKPFELTEIRLRTSALLRMKAASDLLKQHKRELERTIEKRTQSLRGALDKMVAAQRELREANMETIHRLVVATEFKDEDTAQHVMRMSKFSALIARKMGLPPGEVELVAQASPMHDIGKIGTPEEILFKTGELTSNEWEIMKQHTVVGARILHNSHSKLLQLGETIALTHHEKWDGAGYPNGLTGSDIPIWGRICATADVFDALTSARPYKEAYPNDVALMMMQQEAGKHFDPKLVDLLEGCMDEVILIQEDHVDND